MSSHGSKREAASLKETEETFRRVMQRLDERREIEKELESLIAYDTIKRWMRTLHPRLGVSPSHAINQGRIDEVRKIVEKMKHE